MAALARAGQEAHSHTGIGIRICSRIVARPAVQGVGAGAALQYVIARAPFQAVHCAVASHNVVAITGNGVLYHDIPGNHQVTDEPIYIRNALGAQVDTLVPPVRAQVQGVCTAGVVQCQCGRPVKRFQKDKIGLRISSAVLEIEKKKAVQISGYKIKVAIPIQVGQ